MRLVVLPLVSLCFITLQACAVNSAEDVKDTAYAVTSTPLAVEALLFGLLPGPAVVGGGGGGLFVRKQGQVDCVVRRIAPPGGPVSTTVSCNAAGATAMLHEDEARKVFDFLRVEARPTHGGGIDMRKEAFVECFRTAIAPPGGPVSTGTTCTSK